VLLYDSLWHPTKLAYNLEYIQTGLSCLRQMVDAEPVLNARTSISRMIGVVEQAVAHQSPDGALRRDPNLTGVSSSGDQAGSDGRSNAQMPSSHETTFTSMANDFIYLSDRQSQMPAAHHAQQQFVTPADSTTSLDAGPTMADPMSLLDFDVLTTDLYNFFPIQTPKDNLEFEQSKEPGPA
jgi:hypothetical protein